MKLPNLGLELEEDSRPISLWELPGVLLGMEGSITPNRHKHTLLTLQD